MSLLISYPSHALYLPTWVISWWSKTTSEQVTAQQDDFKQKCQNQLNALFKINDMSSGAQKDSTLDKLHTTVQSLASTQAFFLEKLHSNEYDSEVEGFPKINLISTDIGLIQRDIVGYKENQDLTILEKLPTSLTELPAGVAALIRPRSWYAYGFGSLGAFTAYGFLSSDSRNNRTVLTAALLLGASSGIIFHKIFHIKKDYESALNMHKSSLESSLNGLNSYTNHKKGVEEIKQDFQAGQTQMISQLGVVQRTTERVVEGQRLHTEQFDTQQQTLDLVEGQVNQIVLRFDRLQEETKSIADQGAFTREVIVRVENRLISLEELFRKFQQDLKNLDIQLQVDQKKFRQYLLDGTAEVESLKEELTSGLDKTHKLIIISMLESQKQAFQTQQMICDMSQRDRFSRSQSRDRFPIYSSSRIFQIPTFSGSGAFNLGYKTRLPNTGFNLLLTQDASESKKSSVKRSTSQRQITDGKNVLDEIV
jgi:hypothetical protein